MENREILEELLSKNNQDIQSIFTQYIRKTKQYSSFIGLIVDLSNSWIQELEDKILKTKAYTNAIQMSVEDYNIDKTNWAIWVRYLLATEDKETPSMNMVSPIELIKKLSQNMPKISQSQPKYSDYNYLLEQFEDIKQKNHL